VKATSYRKHFKGHCCIRVLFDLIYLVLGEQVALESVARDVSPPIKKVSQNNGRASIQLVIEYTRLSFHNVDFIR